MSEAKEAWVERGPQGRLTVLELVQPLSGESIQKEFVDFFVDDLAADTAKLVGKGCRAVSSGRTTGGGAFAYFDTNGVGGIIFELM